MSCLFRYPKSLAMFSFCRRLCVLLAVLCGIWLSGQRVSAQEQERRDESEEETFVQEELISQMELGKMQELLDEALGEESYSVSKVFRELISGKESFSKETVQRFLYGLFFSRIELERGIFLKLLLIMLAAAFFSDFSSVFENDQIRDICFYMVYLILFALLVHAFGELGENLRERLLWITDFMKGLAPAYFLAVSAAMGSVSGAVFYEGILMVVWLLEWILLAFLLPAVNLYILLKLVNHLSREDMLGKMAELLGTVIGWSLKTIPGAVLGLQTVRAMVAPVVDSLKRSAVQKTAAAIPGIGNTIDSVTEMLLTGAVLVKNSLGVTAMITLFFTGAAPVIHYGVLSLSYRFLAAVTQPVSDKRLVGCLSTMGEGCALLLKVFFTAELLCLLSFVVLMISFGGGV